MATCPVLLERRRQSRAAVKTHRGRSAWHGFGPQPRHVRGVSGDGRSGDDSGRLSDGASGSVSLPLPSSGLVEACEHCGAWLPTAARQRALGATAAVCGCRKLGAVSVARDTGYDRSDIAAVLAVT